ncbi:MAG TPA: hypothetical protein QGH10_25430 [Armatimonadota bacterium]|nr:hypothetical protein [Armatimonadota bacterium]
MRRVSAISGVLVIAACLGLTSAALSDAVVAFEVWPAGESDEIDVDIYAQRMSTGGEPLWGGSEDPVAVAASGHIETSPAVLPLDDGAVLVAYQLEFIEGDHKGDADVYAQLIDADGVSVWNDGESPVPIATSLAWESGPVVIGDGEGGAIIVYEWSEDGGDSDILAQRIGPDGEGIWNDGDTPSIIASSDRPERDPVVVSDGEGGALIVFVWDGPDGNSDVMAQRVTSDGIVLWNEGAQAADVSATPMRETHPVAVSDGRGGALVAFELEFIEGKYKGDVDIMAQRISGDGVRMWNGGDEPAVVSSGSGIERRPVVVSDEQRGVIVAFEYEPLEGEYAGDIDILAQRLGPTGRPLWSDGERSVTVSSSSQLERMAHAVADGVGGMFLVFEHEFRGGDHGGDIDIFAQRLGADGELAWHEGQRSVMVAGSEWYERSPIAVPDGEGGVIVITGAEGPEGKWEGDEDIRAIRVDGAGELVWHDGERAESVSATTLGERNAAATPVR